jgi:hypothetical protein
MPVYFIPEENESDWRMKIGRAKDLKVRRGALQTGNSRPLKIVGWIMSDDDAGTERRLHTKYADRNIGPDGGSSAKMLISPNFFFGQALSPWPANQPAMMSGPRWTQELSNGALQFMERGPI